jgi:hypothetical protein
MMMIDQEQQNEMLEHLRQITTDAQLTTTGNMPHRLARIHATAQYLIMLIEENQQHEENGLQERQPAAPDHPHSGDNA